MCSDERPAAPDLELLSQHSDRYQQLIARSADSSLKIKALTATAVGVLVPLSIERARASLLLVGLILVFGLALLDAYYLSLERSARTAFDDLVKRVRTGTATWSELLTVALPEKPTALPELVRSLCSPATLVFYLLIGALLAVGWLII